MILSARSMANVFASAALACGVLLSGAAHGQVYDLKLTGSAACNAPKLSLENSDSRIVFACAFSKTPNLKLQVTGLPAGTTCKPKIIGSTIVLDCGGNSAPQAPTGCVATVQTAGATAGSTASLASSGGAVNLAVGGCSPASGLTYNWSKNGQPSASASSQWTDSLPANNGSTPTTTSYQVLVCNGSACATFPQSPLTVTVAGAQGGAWNGTCPGFAATHVVTLDPNNQSRQVVGFGPNDVLVVEIKTGAQTTDSSGGSRSSIFVGEYGSAPSGRDARISATPCDFTRQAAMGANADGAVSVQLQYVVGSGNDFNGYYPVLKTNSTYYLNLKNSQNSACAANGACDLFVEPNNLTK